ncbi:MAG: PCMD domain-containing protein [Tannerellaceae bacterium]
MKKCFTSLMVLLCSTVALVSCSDDDKPVTPPTTTSIEGTYKGDKLTGNVEVDGKKTPFESASSITVKRLTDSTATVTLNDIVAGYPIYDISDVKFKVNSGNNSAELDGNIFDNAIGMMIELDANVLNGLMNAEVEIAKITKEKYEGANLVAKINGSVSDTSTVIVQTAADDMMVTLVKAIPGIDSLNIDAEYDITTKGFVKTFKGSKTLVDQNLTVNISGSVEGQKLTIDITSTDLEDANAKPYYNKIFKGDMIVDVVGLGPVKNEQRIYTATPKNRKDNFIKLQISNFSFDDMVLGDINLDTVKCVQKGEAIYFAEKGRRISVGPMPDLGVDFEGTIEGDSLKINLVVDATPLTVNVAFGGGVVTESTNRNASFALSNPAFISPVKKGANYTYYVADNATDLNSVVTVTPEDAKAYVSKAFWVNAATKDTTVITDLNAPVDFANITGDSYLAYTIQSEDVRFSTTYKIFTSPIATSMSFNLADAWAKPNPDNDFEDPFGLASSNPALSFLKAFGMVPADVFAVQKDGTAAKINTIDTKGAFMFTVIPAVTAGTMFNGSFEVDIMNTLKSTKFGKPYAAKPASFTFNYKYTPGPTYMKTVVDNTDPKNPKVSGVEVPGVTDECSIAAYLYEVKDFTEALTGVDINTSNKVIAIAKLANGAAQANFQDVTVDFTYNGVYDASKLYKLAIVCSSSAKGDQFEGAPGSALWIQTLKITNN